jgi:hypothetical protein
MADELVDVESIAPHTYDGIDRPVGTTYQAEAGHLETLRLLGYALPPPAAAERRAQLAAAAPPDGPPPPPATR